MLGVPGLIRCEIDRNTVLSILCAISRAEIVWGDSPSLPCVVEATSSKRELFCLFRAGVRTEDGSQAALKFCIRIPWVGLEALKQAFVGRLLSGRLVRSHPSIKLRAVHRHHLLWVLITYYKYLCVGSPGHISSPRIVHFASAPTHSPLLL